MELKETGIVPAAALPVAALREHLRLASGFADDTTQDVALEGFLRSAIATIEGRVSRALLMRGFVLRLARWRDGCAQPLPLAPVQAITAVTLIDRDGVASVVDPARWRLERDGQRPQLVSTAVLLPTIPTGGAVEIAFEAGFGPDWADLPADLAQAVLLLAAAHYEHRSADALDITLTAGVRALLARWQPVRLMLGERS